MKPHRIQLNFGPARQRPQAVAVLLVLVGVALVGGSAAYLADEFGRRHALTADLALADAAASRSSRPAAKPTVDPQAQTRERASRAVAKSLQRPWEGLLDAVELRPQADVALLAVEPSAQKHSVRITAEARSEDAMLEHLSMLQQDGRLLDLALVSHQKQLQAPGTPWRYQIQGRW